MDMYLGSFSIEVLLNRSTPSSRSSRSGDHQRSRRDSPEYDRRMVKWSQGNMVIIGIINTVQNRHLVMEDMQVQGELVGLW
ncbi:hypothetical protein Tco_0883517 [Tanacetum coccineum]